VAEHVLPTHTEQAGALLIEVGVAPVLVQDVQAVGHAGQYAFELLVYAVCRGFSAGEGFLNLFAFGDVAHVDGETFVGGVVVVLQPLVDGSGHVSLEVSGLAGLDGAPGLDLYL